MNLPWKRDGATRDADLDAEINAHLSMAVAERMSRGETRRSAESAARREFGNVGHVKEVTREMWGGAWIERLLQDARYALRSLRRAPAFTAVAIATLALGIGANTAMFTVVNGVLVRPLPFHEPDRLVLLRYSPPPNAFMNTPGMFDWSYVEFRKRDRIFQSTASFSEHETTLSGTGDPVRVETAMVTADFFTTLGVPAALGRTFAANEDQPGQPDVVILSDRIWRTSFGADPALVGTAVRIDGAPHTVIGIMPAGFDFPFEAKLWVPMPMRINAGFTRLRPIVARLKPGMTPGQASREFAGMAQQLPLHPSVDRSRLSAELLPVKSVVVGEVQRSLAILAAAVGLVLLIACANVANLLLMRAALREHEIALRRALGASRARLVRQLLTESTLLAVIGGACGLVVAKWTVRALVSMAPAGRIPRVDEIRLDWHVLAFALAVSVATGIVFGLVPALVATRTALRDSIGRGARSVGRGHGMLRGSLVVSEIAVALVLLTGAGLMTRSLQHMRAVHLGFNPDRVLTASLSLSDRRYHDVRAAREFDRRAVESLSRLPGVTSAGTINFRPLGQGLMAGAFAIEGGPPLPPEYTADKLVIGGDYFGAMGIRVRGRAFTGSDDDRAPAVVIISSSVAQRFWPNADPIGKRITFADAPTANDWVTIVGVADDVIQRGVTTQPDAAVYQPYGQVNEPGFLNELSIAVRTSTDGDAAATDIRRALRALDPAIAVPAIAPLDELVAATTGDSLFQARLLGAFSALALVLAAVGIYGVLAYGVSERSREIGVRMALGATSGEIIRMVARGTMRLVVPGLLVGTVASVGATRVLEKFLFGVTATDPGTFVAVTVLLGIVGIAAGVGPARRASRVDPVVALRES